METRATFSIIDHLKPDRWSDTRRTGPTRGRWITSEKRKLVSLPFVESLAWAMPRKPAWTGEGTFQLSIKGSFCLELWRKRAFFAWKAPPAVYTALHL